MKKLILLVLVLSMTLTFLPSCAEEQEEEAAETTASTVEAATDIPVKDMQERTITFLTYNRGGGYTTTPEILKTEEQADVINDAIVSRNLTIEENYNVKIECYEDENIVEELNRLTLAGSDGSEVDFVIPSQSYAIAMMVAGHLVPLNDLPYLNFGAEYWDSNMIADTAIGGKNYMMQCDMNWVAWDTTYLVFFNKRIATEENIEDMYALVDEGKWTFETYAEISQRVYRDDGDTVVDKDDTFGTSACNVCVDAFMIGAGITYIQKDANGYLVLPSSTTEQMDNIFNEIVDFCNASETLYTDHPAYKAQRVQIAHDTFTEGRALFFVDCLATYTDLKYMEDEFGMLPLPKYDEEQKEYYTFSHFQNGSCLAIPQMAKDVDDLALIAEAIAYYSHDTVRPAYINNILEGRIAQAENDYRMIDKITSNYLYDFGLILYDYGVPVNTTVRMLVTNNLKALSSQMKSVQKMYSAKVEAINAKVSEID
ncbi:MAG: hypothetical protein IJ038_03205 [Clostridia bacterium]|nr:hypothetical protein [Clostridia bacterium]